MWQENIIKIQMKKQKTKNNKSLINYKFYESLIINKQSKY